jgi:predicted RNA-binding protein YlxR (DUF448 family)
VGCRAQAPKRSLVRMVRDSAGTLRSDPTGTAPGRGAYIHADRGCLLAATRGGGVARAFRVRLAPSEAARLMEELFEIAGVSR